MSTSIHPVKHIRPMRGGSQTHLIMADDGHHYVVKFGDNPQGTRILANEWVAASIARTLGFSAPEFKIIEITQEFLDESPCLAYWFCGKRHPVHAGSAFASRMKADQNLHVTNFLYETDLMAVGNLQEFIGMLCLNMWLDSCDSQQVVFCPSIEGGGQRAWFIDFGYYLNRDWDLRGMLPPDRYSYCHWPVYDSVTDWGVLSPYLCAIESFSETTLRSIIGGIPQSWLDNGDTALLIETLLQRRTLVRQGVTDGVVSDRHPFRNWAGQKSLAAAVGQ